MEYIISTLVVGGIGLAGFVGALLAWQQLSGERIALGTLRGFFQNGQGPLHALQEKFYSTLAVEWLLEKSVPQDSHAADHLLAAWGGFLANHLPTLGELHTLSARRERARTPARFSGGVATVLLVCGVAGTLVAIHPVLSGFTIQVNTDGTVQDASRSAENVMGMIHLLSKSFYPSIAAIVGTLIIVLTRSFYQRAAFELGRELDRFAVDSLLPAFRLRTLGEEFADTLVKLGSLADAVGRRDAEFASAVSSLAQVVTDMRSAGPELRDAAKQVATAATGLAKDATSVVSGLAASFGSNGALVKSISGFEKSVTRNSEAVAALNTASKKLEDTTRTLAGVVQHVPGALEKGCAAGIAQFSDQTRQAVHEATRDVTTALNQVVSPLNSTTVALKEATQEIKTNSQSTQKEISATLSAGKAALDQSVAHFVQSEGAAASSLENLAGFAARAADLPPPDQLMEAANRVTKSSATLGAASERLNATASYLEALASAAASQPRARKPWYKLFRRK